MILLCVPLVLSLGFGSIVIPTLFLGGEDVRETFQQKLEIQSRQSKSVAIEIPQKHTSISAIRSGKKSKPSSGLNERGWILEKAREVKGVKEVELIGTSMASQLSQNNPPEGCVYLGYTLYKVIVTWRLASYKTEEIICVKTNNNPGFGMSPDFTHVFRGR